MTGIESRNWLVLINLSEATRLDRTGNIYNKYKVFWSRSSSICVFIYHETTSNVLSFIIWSVTNVVQGRVSNLFSAWDSSESLAVLTLCVWLFSEFSRKHIAVYAKSISPWKLFPVLSLTMKSFQKRLAPKWSICVVYGARKLERLLMFNECWESSEMSEVKSINHA